MFSSVFICVFFCYILFIWITDVISFLGFYAGFTAKALWPALLAGGFMVPVLRQMIRRKPWNREKLFSGWDMAVVVCFCMFAAGKMVFPDMSEDVCKYHIFLQDPSWKDMMGFHLLPGGIQGFGFPLGDRLFYLFRCLLGYRLGTVLNLLCLLLIYSQARKIMRELCGSRFEKLNPFLCFLAVTQYDAMMQVGSYMVELIGTCILLECVWFLLRRPEDGKEMVVFAGLMGFLFAVKMTNIVYVIPLVILYIFKNRKLVTARIFWLCFLAGVLPASIYLIHNWIQTGNPVYPYYNTVFGSPYFADMIFKDKRWGGQNWKEVILWPFIGIKRPDYRQSELPTPYTWGYASAWLLLAVCRAGRFLKKTRDQAKLGYMAGVIIASSLLWSASTGHVRYYMGGFILLMITGISAGICCMSRTKAAERQWATTCLRLFAGRWREIWKAATEFTESSDVKKDKIPGLTRSWNNGLQ